MTGVFYIPILIGWQEGVFILTSRFLQYSSIDRILHTWINHAWHFLLSLPYAKDKLLYLEQKYVIFNVLLVI